MDSLYLYFISFWSPASRLSLDLHVDWLSLDLISGKSLENRFHYLLIIILIHVLTSNAGMMFGKLDHS